MTISSTTVPRWQTRVLRTPVMAVLVWLASRMLIGGAAVLSQLTQPGGGVLARPDWVTRLLFNWDSGYFLAIAQHGYANQSSSLQAFFPGYPALSRLLAMLFEPASAATRSVSSEALTTSMFVIVQLASLGAAVLTWSLARREHGPAAALLATSLVLLGPYALFLAASYSEALFLFFAVAAWYSARRGVWWVAGLAGIGASFTRINGVFLVAALVVMYLVERHRTGRPLVGGGVFAVMAGGLGAFAYWVYLLILTGSPTAWSQAQATGWNRGFQWPWITLYETVGRALFAATWDRRIQYGLDLVFAVALVVAIVWFFRGRRWPELTLVTLTALSLMTSFTYLSLARNTATLFPLAIALAAAALTSPRRRRGVIALGIVGVLLLVFTTHQFTLGLWAD